MPRVNIMTGFWLHRTNRSDCLWKSTRFPVDSSRFPSRINRFSFWVLPSIKRNQFGLLLRYRIPIELNIVRLLGWACARLASLSKLLGGCNEWTLSRSKKEHLNVYLPVDKLPNFLGISRSYPGGGLLDKKKPIWFTFKVSYTYRA